MLRDAKKINRTPMEVKPTPSMGSHRGMDCSSVFVGARVAIAGDPVGLSNESKGIDRGGMGDGEGGSDASGDGAVGGMFGDGAGGQQGGSGYGGREGERGGGGIQGGSASPPLIFRLLRVSVAWVMSHMGYEALLQPPSSQFMLPSSPPDNEVTKTTPLSRAVATFVVASGGMKGPCQ